MRKRWGDGYSTPHPLKEDHLRNDSRKKLAASRLLFHFYLFLTVNCGTHVFTLLNNNHHHTLKKKNRKSNPNHSPCPFTFAHVHVQEAAGWKSSAANYAFDSCSEPRLPKEREAPDQTPLSRQAALPVCAKLETVKEPGQRAAAGLALGFLL